MSECQKINCPTCGFLLDESFIEQKCPRCQTLIESRFICGSCHSCTDQISQNEQKVNYHKSNILEILSFLSPKINKKNKIQ